MQPVNLEDIYVQLYAYTDQLLKTYIWFRKNRSDSYLKGKQVHDYVMGAIEKYLREPEKFDASSGRLLLTYLKWHIVRTAVGNDARSTENKIFTELPTSDDSNDGGEDVFSNIDALLPFVVAGFDEEMDYKKIMAEIAAELQEDEMAKLIFEEVRCNGMDRRDVIRKYNLEDKAYDNGMKRMKTVLKKIAKRYNYE